MDDKYLYVSCHVKQGNLYDLLNFLQAQKVGNVEVRPIVSERPPTPELKFRTSVRPLVLAAMPLNEAITPREIAARANANVKSVYGALYHFMREKVVRKLGAGKYMRVKEAE